MALYVSRDHRERSTIERVMRVIRAFAEASVVAMGFGVAILLVGTPIALGGLLFHTAAAALVAHPFPGAAALIGSVAVLGLGLVFFFRWRRGFTGLTAGATSREPMPDAHIHFRPAQQVQVIHSLSSPLP